MKEGAAIESTPKDSTEKKRKRKQQRKIDLLSKIKRDSFQMKTKA
jgi:hypothetical protein